MPVTTTRARTLTVHCRTLNPSFVRLRDHQTPEFGLRSWTSSGGGRITPLMLRMGWTSLVSLLVGMKSPGWKDVRQAPLRQCRPTWAISHQARTTVEEKSSLFFRSSYFLPSAESEETTSPPSPMVTEVGLSLCVRKFLHSNTPTGVNSASSSSSSNQSPPHAATAADLGVLRYSKIVDPFRAASTQTDAK